MEESKRKRLQELARNIRIDIVQEVAAAKSGHPGGSLSIADVMAYLYGEEMRVDPRIRRTPIATVLSSPKGIARRRFTPRWPKKDFSRKKS